MNRAVSFVRSAAMAVGLVVSSVVGQAALGQAERGQPAQVGQAAQVGLIELSGTPADRPGPLAWLLGATEPTLRDYVLALEATAEDRDYDAVILRLLDPVLTTSQVEELGAAMSAFRDTGKSIHVFAEALGPAEFMLGSYADELLVQKGGPVSLPGLYMEEMFLAGTLEWAGLRADFVQVGDYKGASEPYTRRAPSPQWEQNISGLLDAMYENMRAKLREGRGLGNAELDAAMEDLWLATADDAVRHKLADAAVDLDGLMDHLGSYHGEAEYVGEIGVGESGPAIDMTNPFAALAVFAQQPPTDAVGPTIAVLHLEGPIVDGDSTASGLLGGASVGSRTLRRAMQDIADDEDILGVIVRIDSPGGSATASEVIWQGLRTLAKSKPVWASVGSMAASGGYYSAVGAEKIYANPSSILGSIGVVGGKVTMGELFERGQLGITQRARGPRAAMLSTVTGWDEADKALVRHKMAQTYDLFTARVAEGRPGIDLGRVAEGRLFLGTDAVRLGLADSIGGLDIAIEDMAARLDLDHYDVIEFPRPQSLEEIIEETFGSFVAAPSLSAAARPAARAAITDAIAQTLGQAMGPARFRAVRDQLEALILMRDQPVLLVSPTAIIVR